MATALGYALSNSSRPRTKREYFEKCAAGLVGLRTAGGFDSHWQDIATFLSPSRVRFTTSDANQGGKQRQNIIDSSGSFALQTLRSGLHAGLTSPARPWFKLSTPDPDLAEFPSVKEWLHITTARMRTVFASTNLYQALPMMYGDFGGFGTAACGMFDDTEDLFRCYAYPLGSYAMGLNARGLVSSFTREYRRSVAQLVEEFGVRSGYRDIDWSKLSSVVKTAWDNGEYQTMIDVCQVIEPNVDYRRDNPLSRYKKFSSVHFETGNREGSNGDRFLRESGFDEFPILAPRWETTGSEDVYGTDCPGMTALGDVRQLQMEAKRKGQLLQRAVAPALTGPSSLRTQKVSLNSGDITYVDAREGQQGLRPIHEIRLEGFQHITADIQDVRYLIRRAFFEDLFLMLASSDPNRGSQPITAREVEERHEEKLIALGPVLEKTDDELLEPLIDRAFAMMLRKGLLPEPPPELEGVNLKVEFTSILAQAQKLVGISSLDRFVLSVSPIIQADPSLRHKVNGEQIIDSYGDALGIDPRILRSPEETKALVDAEQEQVQAAQDATNMAQMAQAASNAGKEPIATDSALDRVLQGVTG